MAGKKAEIRTELQRVFYVDGDRTIQWLADRLGVRRHIVGKWLSGEEKVPRRRQLQILVHLGLESKRFYFFDDEGFARRIES